MKRLIDKLRTEISTVCGILTILTVTVLAESFYAPYSRGMLIAASTGFVLIAAVSLVKNRSGYGIFALIALIFCWLGDFLGPYDFRSGLVAFALAHLFFITAFYIHGISRIRSLIFLGIFLIFGAIILHWLYPFIPASDRIFVISYMSIITSMVAHGLATRSSISRILISIGAVLFYISDIFVARWRFVDKSSINALCCYPMYYSSCILLAFSILAYKRGKNETDR